MHTGAFDVASDHFSHFARVERLIDVITGAEPQRFLCGFESAETGEHDDGKMWINFTDSSQTFDAGGTRHADVHHDGIGLFLLQEFNAGIDAIGRMHILIWLEQHAQALARTHFVVDNQDLRSLRRDGHNRPSRLEARRVPHAAREDKYLQVMGELGWEIEIDFARAQASICE